MALAVTTLSTWSEQDVRVADVLGVLEELRRPEPMPATRTSVLTLVVVATKRSSAARATDALYELGGRHPARVLTLLLEPQGPPGTDATVRLLGADHAGRAVWFEEIDLTVRGAASSHLDSFIEPFTIADLPVVVWWVDGVPETGDRMVGAADVVLVDARDFGEAECFEALARLRPNVVVDLSWHRLRPWRELLASLFDGPDARPFVTAVRSVRVLGRTGPRHLLAGWIIDRLAVPHAAVHLDSAEHVSIEVVAVDDQGRRGVFAVTRTTDERAVAASVVIEGGATAQLVVPLLDTGPAWGLQDALANLRRDAVYEGALDAALALSAR